MLLQPGTKLRQGNVFTPVCDSVHRGWISPQGGLCPRGSLSRKVSVQWVFEWGVSVWWGSLSMGISVLGGLSRGSLSIGGLCWGVSVGGSLSMGGLCQGDPQPLFGYVRAVHIVLECILVFFFFKFLEDKGPFCVLSCFGEKKSRQPL